MEKQFSIVLDTKKSSFNNIRGLKQGDNNSVLNITLVQNSIPFNLNNCTVRINYKRPDGRVLLQTADIVNIEGEIKVKVNILTKALEIAGEVKADISVFSVDNKKITSATFNMQVENSVYTKDSYFSDKDLDLMQQEYLKEQERIKEENTRNVNENTRKSEENTRKTNESNRNKNEENRKLQESNRVKEFNYLKDVLSTVKFYDEKEIVVNRNSQVINPLSTLNYTGVGLIDKNKLISINTGGAKPIKTADIQILNNKIIAPTFITKQIKDLIEEIIIFKKGGM